MFMVSQYACCHVFVVYLFPCISTFLLLPVLFPRISHLFLTNATSRAAWPQDKTKALYYDKKSFANSFFSAYFASNLCSSRVHACFSSIPIHFSLSLNIYKDLSLVETIHIRAVPSWPPTSPWTLVISHRSKYNYVAMEKQNSELYLKNCHIFLENEKLRKKAQRLDQENRALLSELQQRLSEANSAQKNEFGINTAPKNSATHHRHSHKP